MPRSRASKAPKISLEKVLETTAVKLLQSGLTSILPAQENEPSFRRKRNEISRSSSPLTRLGVSLADYRNVPKISPILREIPGGKSKALKAMRMSESPLIQSFLEKYNSISPTDREKCSLEAIALSAKIDVRHLWGEIMLAMREHSVNSVKVIAIANHPDVIHKRVEFAKLPGGTRDRDALDIMLGALPSPKGPTFINKFFAGGSSAPDEETDNKSPQVELVDDLDYVFPDASAMQDRAQPIRQKALAK
jgi:hypothetical protein